MTLRASRRSSSSSTRYVFRTAYGLTGDRGLAEEILQDTFVRAYRHRANLWADRSPLPWLNRVALNLCYSRLGPPPAADAGHGRRRHRHAP